MQFLLGADPEVFVSREGVFVPAIDLVPGTKTEPHIVPNGAVQVDGLALEFNINPAESYDEFQNNLDIVLNILQDMVPDYEFMKVPAIALDPMTKAKIDPKDLIRGCSPDLNAYTEESNTGPAEDCDIHAAGGHLHIGNIFPPVISDRDKFDGSLRLVRLLDKHVGVYSLLWDTDTLRRQVYGKAGSCRLKSYGVEYRSLSNAWLFNKNITKFVYKQVARAVEDWNKGIDVESDHYRHIIDNNEQGSPYFANNKYADEVMEALAA